MAKRSSRGSITRSRRRDSGKRGSGKGAADTSDPIQAAIAAARVHLERDAFEDAEREICQADSSIQGNVPLMRIYKDHLRSVVASASGGSDRERVERVFRRALSWAQSCYPEPHTADESESYEAGRVRDRADLVAILGYDPDAPMKRR